MNTTDITTTEWIKNAQNNSLVEINENFKEIFKIILKLFESESEAEKDALVEPAEETTNDLLIALSTALKKLNQSQSQSQENQMNQMILQVNLPLIDHFINSVDSADSNADYSAINTSIHDLWRLYTLEVNNLAIDQVTTRPPQVAYTPINTSFRPMLRWLLYTLAAFLRDSNFNPALCLELEEELVKCSDTDAVYIPTSTLDLLSTCHPYNFLAYFLLEGPSFSFPTTTFFTNSPTTTTTTTNTTTTTQSDKDENNELIFLDTLIASRFLKICPDLLPSIKEMVQDTTPFYESTHLNIIAAFMSSQTSNILSLDAAVTYLDAVFARFDRNLTYPYDIEDALLIWINMCLAALNPTLASIEDLTKDVDAATLALVVGAYTSPVSSTQPPSDPSSDFRVLDAWGFVPWRAVDLHPEGNGHVYASVVYVNFLASVMRWCIDNQRLVFPPSAAAVGDEEDAVGKDTENLCDQENVTAIGDEEESVSQGKENVCDQENVIVNGAMDHLNHVMEKERNVDQVIEKEGTVDLLIEKEKDTKLEIKEEKDDDIVIIEKEEVAVVEEELEEKEVMEENGVEVIEEIEIAVMEEDNEIPDALIEHEMTLGDETPKINTRLVLPQILAESLSSPPSTDHEWPFPVMTRRRASREPRLRRQRVSKVVLAPISNVSTHHPPPPLPIQVFSVAVPEHTLDFNTFPPNMPADSKAIFDSAVDLLEKEEGNRDTQELLEETFNSNKEDEVEVARGFEQEDNDSVPKDNILISNKALQMLLGEEEEESDRDNSPPRFLHEDTDDEDEGGIDQATLDLINNIKNIGNGIVQDPGEEDAEESVAEYVYDDGGIPFEKTNQQLNEEITELDILDYYTVDEKDQTETEKEVVQVEELRSTPSRPKTGLQNYPIPEHDANQVLPSEQGEAAWKRAQESTLLSADTKKDKTAVKTESLSMAFAPATETKKSSLEVLIEIKEERQRKQHESKILKVNEIKQKRKAQVENQNKIIAEKEQQRSIIRNGLAAPSDSLSSSSSNHQIAPAAGPRRRTPASKRRTLATKTNKNLIKNALMHVSLAGSLNKGIKEEVLQDLNESDAGHFVLLFRDANNFTFRGLYFWDHALDQTLKLYSGCHGPTELNPRAVIEFYKYDSGARTFKAIPTKSFGRSVDAVAIGREYFLPKV